MKNYNKKYTLETKLAAVKEYLDGADSIRVIAKKYHVSKTMLHRWVSKYQIHGEDAFPELYTKYSLEFKMDVLNYMNETGASAEEATAVFNVSASSVVQNWKHLADSKGVDALQSKKKERSPMAKKPSKKKLVEGSKEVLQAEIEQLRMENAYLKKLQTLIQNKKK